MSTNVSASETSTSFSSRTAWARNVETPLREFLRTETGGGDGNAWGRTDSRSRSGTLAEERRRAGNLVTTTALFGHQTVPHRVGAEVRLKANGERPARRGGALLKDRLLTNIVLASGRRGSADRSYFVRFGRSFGRNERLGMNEDLSYDMALEAQGLFRSLILRTTLDRELSVGETFTVEGRDWVVSRMERGKRDGLDWRVVARELVPAEAA